MTLGVVMLCKYDGLSIDLPLSDTTLTKLTQLVDELWRKYRGRYRTIDMHDTGEARTPITIWAILNAYGCTTRYVYGASGKIDTISIRSWCGYEELYDEFIGIIETMQQ